MGYSSGNNSKNSVSQSYSSSCKNGVDYDCASNSKNGVSQSCSSNNKNGVSSSYSSDGKNGVSQSCSSNSKNGINIKNSVEIPNYSTPTSPTKIELADTLKDFKSLLDRAEILQKQGQNISEELSEISNQIGDYWQLFTEDPSFKSLIKTKDTKK